jgi:hypothetical protein
MRARILKPDEWGRLPEKSNVPALLPYVEPSNAAMVVVEKGSDEIAACVSVLRVSHFEGLWIRPEDRGNAGVFRALIRQAYALPQVRGERWILGAADLSDDRMDVLCRRLGGCPLPVEFYAMPVSQD